MFSTYALTDAAGAVVERYTYTAYGKVTTYDVNYLNPMTVSRVGNPYTFTGRRLDAETGLMHYRARTYDPVEGRFKQLDQAGMAEGPNLYQYVGSAPVAWLDPLGLLSPRTFWHEWDNETRGQWKKSFEVTV
jgi:RHS repeat-associated protein